MYLLLQKIDHIDWYFSSLNVWYNSPIPISQPEVYFIEKNLTTYTILADIELLINI